MKEIEDGRQEAAADLEDAVIVEDGNADAAVTPEAPTIAAAAAESSSNEVIFSSSSLLALRIQ